MSMTFEDLEAWQKARRLVNDVYALSRNNPLASDFGLCNQIQRAAVSVMSNVAEGFQRAHGGEKFQAYNIARASCGEVRSLLYVIEDNYPSSASAAQHTRCLVDETGSLISGLIASTRRRAAGKLGGEIALLALMSWIGIHLIR
ncbi:MAG TPA: four helix bundle protein [Candidatus Paceibacterota bacterium]|nr:four helix bundle protein [Verrucomicrobiota bacterium]HSA12730.1 four helix bundle protein [Candidatus Paceibacterota bacterium]